MPTSTELTSRRSISGRGHEPRASCRVPGGRGQTAWTSPGVSQLESMAHKTFENPDGLEALIAEPADVTLNREQFPAASNLLGFSAVGFIAGLVLGVPLVGATVGAMIGGAGTAIGLTSAGIGDDFVREVRGLMKPGTSAIFLLDCEGGRVTRGIGRAIPETCGRVPRGAQRSPVGNPDVGAVDSNSGTLRGWPSHPATGRSRRRPRAGHGNCSWMSIFGWARGEGWGASVLDLSLPFSRSRYLGTSCGP
jgi:Protein of unknown function (DUF1269)